MYTRKFKTLQDYNSAFSTLESPSVSIIEDLNKIIFTLLDDKRIVGELDENYKITLDSSLTDTDYVLKYEDCYENPIANFKSFNISSLQYISENIAPYSVAQIGVYTVDTDTRMGGIFLASLHHDFGKRLYRFGVLSDVHHDNTYDKYFYSGDTSYSSESDPESASDFQNAIKFLDKKEDVCMTCICGDLTVQQGETASPFYYSEWAEMEKDNSHLADMDSFKYNVNKISTSTPIFVARGNHDMGAMLNASSIEILNRKCSNRYDLWKYYTYPKITNKWKDLGFSELTQKSTWDYEKGYIDALLAQQKTESYYFTKINEDGHTDVFIFLSLNTNAFWTDNMPAYNDGLDEHTIDWLEEVLETYRNNRCFVFTHLFFKDKAGNTGHHYDNGTWYDTDEYAKINELNNHYKNAIFISGHSHFKWNLQQYGTTPNITSADTSTSGECGYNLHIPSCAYPRTFDPTVADGTKSLINHNKESEGAIIDVYADYVDVRGIVFKSESDTKYTNLYEPMAQYRIMIGGNNLFNIDAKS